ncbi:MULTISPECIES: hypothetical protein [Levilactobacillus]|uniref:hypothetical protein n=1 Tax=Levilactobacillus TaxID=2767886 RepID=UPI0037571C2B
MQKVEKYLDGIRDSYPLWKFSNFPESINLYSLTDKKIEIDWVRLYLVNLDENDNLEYINGVRFDGIESGKSKFENIFPGENAVCVSPYNWKINKIKYKSREHLVAIITANTQSGEQTVFFQGSGLSASYVCRNRNFKQYDGDSDKKSFRRATKIYKKVVCVGENTTPHGLKEGNIIKSFIKRAGVFWGGVSSLITNTVLLIGGFVLFVAAVLLQRYSVFSIGLLAVSALFFAVCSVRMLIRIFTITFDWTNGLVNKYKFMRNSSLIYSLKYNDVAKSPYFFEELNSKLKDHPDLKLSNSSEEENVLKMRLKHSVTKEDGLLNIRAIFERDDKYIEIVKLISLEDLYSWKKFFETKEAPHSVQSFLRNLVYSAVSITVIRAIWKMIVVYVKVNPILMYVYLTLTVILIGAFAILYYVDRANQEKLSSYNLNAIINAIQIKEKERLEMKSRKRQISMEVHRH